MTPQRYQKKSDTHLPTGLTPYEPHKTRFFLKSSKQILEKYNTFTPEPLKFSEKRVFKIKQVVSNSPKNGLNIQNQNLN